jgi:hypothetical protein
MHPGELPKCRSLRAGSPEGHTGAAMYDLLRRLRCPNDDLALQRRDHGRARPIAILAKGLALAKWQSGTSRLNHLFVERLSSNAWGSIETLLNARERLLGVTQLHSLAFKRVWLCKANEQPAQQQ